MLLGGFTLPRSGNVGKGSIYILGYINTALAIIFRNSENKKKSIDEVLPYNKHKYLVVNETVKTKKYKHTSGTSLLIQPTKQIYHNFATVVDNLLLKTSIGDFIGSYT